MKMCLMDRQRRVDCSAAAMDDGCARECYVDQPRPEEVERHLVGHSRYLRRDRVQQAEIVCRRLGKECRLVYGSARAMPRCPMLVPEMQFAAGTGLRMAGDDLL